MIVAFYKVNHSGATHVDKAIAWWTSGFKAKGLELYNEKWLAEQEVEAISMLEELIAYENPVSKDIV